VQGGFIVPFDTANGRLKQQRNNNEKTKSQQRNYNHIFSRLLAFAQKNLRIAAALNQVNFFSVKVFKQSISASST
jgi:hypothetical protein